MKKVFILLLTLPTGLAYAAVGKDTVMGPGNYTNKTVGDLEIMGPLKGSGLKANAIEIYGPATLSNGSQIESAIIRGPLTASDTTFTSTVEVYGNVKAQGSTFKDDLTVEGNDIEVRLEDTPAKNITLMIQSSGVQKSGDSTIYTYFFSTKKPVGNRVILKGKKTIVDGSIEFVNGEGTVALEDGARLIGKVIGGKLEESKKDVEKKETK